jgi:hypothetical protein
MYAGSSYVAHASVAATASAARIRSAFTIEVRFVGGLSAVQMNAFKEAAKRWSRVIVGDIPTVQVEGEDIDDLLILAEGKAIDGTDGILGESGPTVLRPKAAGPYAYLPAKGEMTFDAADLTSMEQSGTLHDVIAHEMGHVLGFGTIWARKRLLVGATTANPTFKGKQAKREYGKLCKSQPQPVPVENLGGKGTRNSHWREVIFASELMSGFFASHSNPLSALTVASMADLGYTVDMSRAEPYALPSASRRATNDDVSLALVHRIPVLRQTVAVVLPDEALV